MISLKDDNWLLRLTTSSASAVHVHVSYSDTLTSTISGLNVTQIIHGSQSTVISSATTTTICDSPAEDTSRLIHHISIRSISGSVTVSPHLFNGSTSFQLPICSLDSAAAWVYVGMEGWKKTLSNGDLVVTTGTGGGGGGGWTDVTVTDADFTAANDTRYYIPGALLTANRTVNMGSITTKVMFVNAEPDYFLNFSTASVYALAGTEEISSLMSLATTHIEKIDTKLIVIN
jgi:hypothetical protein